MKRREWEKPSTEGRITISVPPAAYRRTDKLVREAAEGAGVTVTKVRNRRPSPFQLRRMHLVGQRRKEVMVRVYHVDCSTDADACARITNYLLTRVNVVDVEQPDLATGPSPTREVERLGPRLTQRRS